MSYGRTKTVKTGYTDRPCLNPVCCRMAAPSHPYCGEACYEKFKREYLDPHRKILLPLLEAAGGVYCDPSGSWWMHLWGDILAPEKNAHICFVCEKRVTGTPKHTSPIQLHLRMEHDLRWIRQTWQFITASVVDPPLIEALQTFTKPKLDSERLIDDDARVVGRNQFSRIRQRYHPSLLDEEGVLAWWAPDFLARVDALRAGLRS